jgi:tRNA(Ile)-lysidine synthase
MASTRKSPPADAAAPIAALHQAIAQLTARDAAAKHPLRIAIALSGGRDSMVLLDVAARLRAELALEVSAVHVHHGLQAAADAWSAFCARECAARGVALAVARVHVLRRGGESLEAAARDARYAVLRRAGADAVALAHHADDQAETVLLQLARGAGPHGLAAMPALQVHGRGHGHEHELQHPRHDVPALIRPFLALPAATLAAYAGAHALAWVDDPSNDDTALRRNALRHEITPLLARAFPGYPATLARAALHQAEAARLLDDLAALDARAIVIDDAGFGTVLDRAALGHLARTRPDRARNVLRWFLRRHRLPPPSTARLDALLAQCGSARSDARVQVAHAGSVIESHRGLLVVHAQPGPAFECAWRGEAELVLPAGTLTATPEVGRGLATTALRASLRIASRRGGERLRIAHDAAPRSVGGWLARTSAPSWQRNLWPIVWCRDTPVAVPGLGVDPDYAAAAGDAGCVLRWTPNAR